MPTARITKPYTAKSRPIIFNGEMVRAILDGRKTQTRRVIKPTWSWLLDGDWSDDFIKIQDSYLSKECPCGKKEDFLWVRETWMIDGEGIRYRADQKEYDVPLRWKSPIHLRRKDSRISLRIVDIKVERIQDISSLDIVKEGITPVWTGMAKDFDQEKWGYLDLSAVSPEDVISHYENLYENFIELWDSINAKRGYSWESNPWVWLIEFEKIELEAAV